MNFEKRGLKCRSEGWSRIDEHSTMKRPFTGGESDAADRVLLGDMLSDGDFAFTNLRALNMRSLEMPLC